MLRTSLIAFAFLVPLAIAEDKPAGELDGTYELKEFFENGKGSDEKRDILSIVFKDGTMTVKSMVREDVAKFTLDSTKKPAQIDFKPTTGEPKTTLGIWKVEKGELTVVFSKNGARPTDFKGLGDGVVKFVMAKMTVPKKDK